MTTEEMIDKYLGVYNSYVKMMGDEKIGIRTYMWNLFAGLVAEHVQHYTIPQYGDYPNDNIASWTAEDCLKQIQKYSNRFFSNSRGEGELDKDLMKIAHYASLVYLKRQGVEEKFKALLPKETTNAE